MTPSPFALLHELCGLVASVVVGYATISILAWLTNVPF